MVRQGFSMESSHLNHVRRVSRLALYLVRDHFRSKVPNLRWAVGYKGSTRVKILYSINATKCFSSSGLSRLTILHQMMSWFGSLLYRLILSLVKHKATLSAFYPKPKTKSADSDTSPQEDSPFDAAADLELAFGYEYWITNGIRRRDSFGKCWSSPSWCCWEFVQKARTLAAEARRHTDSALIVLMQSERQQPDVCLSELI